MATDLVPDSERTGLIGALPRAIRPYASLMRLDRPIGTWLLYWPCAWSVALAGVRGEIALFAWLLLGAFVMRSAGCAYNDIVDRDLDRRVERTRLRPLASGRVSLKSAWALVVGLSLAGLVVLLQLNPAAQIVALLSLAPVAAYPFMKRITWWPQAWLGLVFTWGGPVGWIALRSDHLEVLAALYAGAFFWCMGYDTIYALQDREDDALVGIRSSALRLGRHVRAGVAAFYIAATGLWLLAFWLLRSDPIALLALAPAALHLAWQVATLDPADSANPLTRFRSNRFAGALVAAACFVVGNA
jgi:4-hydroxybenzoate polyprenyltransferase